MSPKAHLALNWLPVLVLFWLGLSTISVAIEIDGTGSGFIGGLVLLLAVVLAVSLLWGRRYSLRALLIATAITCVWLGIAAYFEVL